MSNTWLERFRKKIMKFQATLSPRKKFHLTSSLFVPPSRTPPCRRPDGPVAGRRRRRSVARAGTAAVDEVRKGEDQNGDGSEDGGRGENARLVGVAAEVADGQYHQHIADVVDVADEAGERAGQAEAALDLRDDRRVVGDADAGDDPQHRHGRRERPDGPARTQSRRPPRSQPAPGLSGFPLRSGARVLRLPSARFRRSAAGVVGRRNSVHSVDEASRFGGDRSSVVHRRVCARSSLRRNGPRTVCLEKQTSVCAAVTERSYHSSHLTAPRRLS